MQLTTRHFSLFGGSLRSLFKRESDRRRLAGSPFEWLFHPYLGEELVALAFRFAPTDPILSVAAVVFNERRVLTQNAWVATLADRHTVARRALRRHQVEHPTPALMAPTAENIATLAEFIGNRPVVGWGLDQTLGPVNRLFDQRLGFELPNAQVDIERLYQRRQKRSSIDPRLAPDLDQALRHARLTPPGATSLLGEASACALLYMRLTRDAALEA
ncbi:MULTISPECIES: DNA polymerase III subunit epsilon [unclassified Halomonas]|uniref:DNA polymerase III subunit epsilon n=1 Tax=unclassified Halomonas TaxID=2609666 RepID=UPI0021E50930|nr:MULTISPECIES: DNA polymerase III subunit epsilon [unclassified Halomonas]UYG00555.1 DNA polymerase III subunit epsilon [Halomonas sp. GD1P12]WNL38370.1 DNA polymerase III subunit epsilon [Halomonas sp. PAMB 3232]WNL41670.1 DNA polymerase III subunit epsilon [Halomonas sp. PAMB 3264]